MTELLEMGMEIGGNEIKFHHKERPIGIKNAHSLHATNHDEC